MDVISEIKKFEQHPDRAHFSTLQISDFYKTIIGQLFKFEAIISTVRKGTNCDCEILADTYSYTILHNPVAERDYLNWAPDLHFCCEANKDDFKFNPLTDLIKGDRFHCAAVFMAKNESELRVRITSFQKVPFLEVEKERELLEKKFNSAYEEQSIYAPQRQFQQRAMNKSFIYFSIGGLVGATLGLFWGTLNALFDSNSSIFGPGIAGAVIGGIVFGAIGMVLGFVSQGRR